MRIAPDAYNGRRNSAGLAPRLKNIPPKITTMNIGVSSSIFASGARRIDRKPASVIADACSDIHGSCLSMKDSPAFKVVDARGAAAPVARALSGRRGFDELKSPVYKRSVVR